MVKKIGAFPALSNSCLPCLPAINAVKIRKPACVKLLFGLLVSIFEGIVGQCCFVARVLHHVVPCDQSLANGCSPWLKTLWEEKKDISYVYESKSRFLQNMFKMKLVLVLETSINDLNVPF